jgi:hypothetical protein
VIFSIEPPFVKLPSRRSLKNPANGL